VNNRAVTLRPGVNKPAEARLRLYNLAQTHFRHWWKRPADRCMVGFLLVHTQAACLALRRSVGQLLGRRWMAHFAVDIGRSKQAGRKLANKV
jgi:hypothetical protein